MNTRDFLAGIGILLPYYKNPDGYNMGSDHDQVYMFAPDRPLTDEDVKKMHDLGWCQLKTPEGTYNQEETWTAYI